MMITPSTYYVFVTVLFNVCHNAIKMAMAKDDDNGYTLRDNESLYL